MRKKAYAVFNGPNMIFVGKDQAAARQYFLSFPPDKRKTMFICAKLYRGMIDLTHVGWKIIEAGDCVNL